MGSSDITVIPTGGSVPVDLADLAARVSAPAMYYAALITGSGNTVQFLLSKMTGAFETPLFYFDGSPTPLKYDFGPMSRDVFDMPDGMFNYGWSPSLTTALKATGSHTILVKTTVTNTQLTIPYTM